MAKWYVTGDLTYTGTVLVTAPTRKEALAKAEECDFDEVMHQSDDCIEFRSDGLDPTYHGLHRVELDSEETEDL